jgi:hypothetical protein
MDRVHEAWRIGLCTIIKCQPLIERSTIQIKSSKGYFGLLILTVDRSSDDCGFTDNVAVQRAAAHHGRGGGSSKLGVAHATGHQSQHGLALWDHRSVGNPFN